MALYSFSCDCPGTVTFNGTVTVPTSWSNTSITAPVPIGAANGLLVVTVNGFQANPVPFSIIPRIGSFTPNAGPVGTQVTISGSGFGVSQGFGGVTFNSLSAAVQSWNDTSISVIIPTGATIGSDDVVVTASNLLAGSGMNFTVNPLQLVSLAVTPAELTIAANNSQQFKATGTLSDGTTSDYTTAATWNSSNASVVSISSASGSEGLAVMEVAGTTNITATVGTVSGSTSVTVQTPAVPNITGVSPSSGTPGTQVTITGSGFGADQRGGSALLGSILGTIVSWSDGAVVAAVAPGSISGGVQVLQNGLTSNRVSFTINAPTVTSIAPTSGVPGSQVTISGSGFGTSPGSGKVWLGSTYGTVVTWDDTQITAVVAPSASSGKAQVMQGGTWSNSVGFSVNGPTITSLTPTNGLPGTQVTITGSGFGTSQGSGQIFLGTAPAIVTSWTDAGIQATVSQGSSTGTAQILQNGALSNAFTFTVNIPQITTLSPGSGAVGTSVTISGSGFGESQGGGVVWIGSAPGTVTVWSDGQVQATVAANAVSGIVKVEQNGIWSNALNFVVPQSAGTSVTLSPNLVSMVVGETRSLQAVDNTGTPVNGLSWTSSDTTLATLSNDDPPIITAVAPGHVTIIAGNASTDLTIYPDSLPLGTIKWSVPGDSSGVANFLAAVPSDTGVADVFAQSGNGNIQAIKTDGSIAWTTNIGAPSPGLRLIPDFQGGLTFVKTDPAQPTQDAILRLDGTTGQSTTTYSFQNKIESEMLFTVDEPRRTRVFTDGTVVTVDGDTVIGIDPQTRASKFSIKLEHSTVGGPSGHCIGDNTNTDQFPAIGNFIIAGDGYAYLVYQYSGFAVTPFGAYEVGHQEEHTRVLRVGPDGDSSKLAVNDWTDDWNARFFCPGGGLMSRSETQSGARASLVDSSFSVPPGGTGPLITNADQGVLLPMTLNWGGYFACESSNCFVSIPLSATHPLAIISSSGSVSQVATNIPGQGGWLIPSLQAEDGTFFGQMDDTMIAFDQSGAPKWTVPGNFTPLRATADGGLIAQSGDTGASVSFDANGNLMGLAPLPNAVMSWSGNWYDGGSRGIGLSSSVDLIASPPVMGALSLWATNGGNPSANGTASRPWYFVLAWQNDFKFIPDYPDFLTGLTTDINFLAPAVKAAALRELQDAYSGLPVTVVEGTAGTGDDWATVLNSQTLVAPGFVPCGATNSNAIGSDGRVHSSQVDYTNNMLNAQSAYKISITNSQQESAALKRIDLIQAIGRGLGTIAAHEIAHHFLGKCCAMDADPAQDPDARGAINATGCDGLVDPSPWTGFWPSPFIGLHWEPVTLQGLTRCLSKGWRDIGNSSCFLQ